MLNLTIPDFGEVKIQHVVLDFNGTLAVDGSLLDDVEIHLRALSTRFHLHVLTGDTHGSAKKELANVNCEVNILPAENQAIAKANYVINLDADHVIAIGNGRNDQQMLQVARIGIAVLGQEGLALSALSSANIVVPDIFSAFSLLRDNKRLLATLRA